MRFLRLVALASCGIGAIVPHATTSEPVTARASTQGPRPDRATARWKSRRRSTPARGPFSSRCTATRSTAARRSRIRSVSRPGRRVGSGVASSAIKPRSARRHFRRTESRFSPSITTAGCSAATRAETRTPVSSRPRSTAPVTCTSSDNARSRRPHAPLTCGRWTARRERSSGRGTRRSASPTPAMGSRRTPPASRRISSTSRSRFSFKGRSGSRRRMGLGNSPPPTTRSTAWSSVSTAAPVRCSGKSI